jgi:hypothetical protein
MVVEAVAGLSASSAWTMTVSELVVGWSWGPAGLEDRSGDVAVGESTGEVRRRFLAELFSSSNGLGLVGTGSGEEAGRSGASGEAVAGSIWLA